MYSNDVAAGHVIRLSEHLRQQQPRADSSPAWSLTELSGRLSEISGQGAVASLTAAFCLVHRAQLEKELVAWIALESSAFFPPDVEQCGVDLHSLVVVRVPSDRAAARATDHLLRSGAFGLIVLDLGERADIAIPMQGRLVGLAKRHDTAVVCLTEKPTSSPSIGSMVSLRAEARRHVDAIRIRIVKDKRRGPSWSHEEKVRGPAGLR